MTTPITPSAPPLDLRTPRLEAIGAVRLLIGGARTDALTLIGQSDSDSQLLATACIDFAGALLTTNPDIEPTAYLDGYLDALVENVTLGDQERRVVVTAALAIRHSALGEPDAVAAIVTTERDRGPLAWSAVQVAADVLAKQPRRRRQRILDGLTDITLSDEGGNP